MAQDTAVVVAQKTDETNAQPQRVFKLVGTGDDPLLGARNVVISNSAEVEDEFKQFYVSGIGKPRILLAPPFDLKLLKRLCQENNALQPCIEAMVTNIDGTGFEFIADDMKPEEQDTDEGANDLWDFFGEPWPGESFVTIRKQVRRDVEQTGNGYIEVIRNALGELCFMRYADSTLTRLVELDQPVVVSKTITRKGVTAEMRVSMRERRFAQMSGGNRLIYFKEFGSERDLDKFTGEWAIKGKTIPYQRRASELLHYKALPSIASPYGVPRWISQLPSVLGSRKAEEFNLEFFDNGGVPPVLILLQGGVLSPDTRRAIENKTLGKASAKNRIQVVEAEPTGGSIDSPGTAKITVERFGAERQNDSMFEGYDDKCEEKIRRSFRLPALFVGSFDGASFATAYVSYATTEKQVFEPERTEFDESISLKVLPLFQTSRKYRMRSRGMSITDTAVALKGLELAIGTDFVEPADIIRQVNELTGTTLKVATEKQNLPQNKVNTPANSINPDTGLPYHQNQPTETAKGK